MPHGEDIHLAFGRYDFVNDAVLAYDNLPKARGWELGHSLARVGELDKAGNLFLDLFCKATSGFRLVHFNILGDRKQALKRRTCPANGMKSLRHLEVHPIAAWLPRGG